MRTIVLRSRSKLDRNQLTQVDTMQLGMIGLGRMGANMVRRLSQGGHACVVFDTHPGAVKAAIAPGVTGCASVADLVALLAPPRVLWLMLPAAVVDQTVDAIASLLEAGDIIIDGGNSWYGDDIRRAQVLQEREIEYIDVGTSGGVAGLERGYCLMIGGKKDVVTRLEPIFATLAPGVAVAPLTPGRHKPGSSAEQGYLHCGAAGAGHFVKMIHNGIEYGLMGAYAEGFNILKNANAGLLTGHKGGHDGASSTGKKPDAETAPLRHPEQYQYEFDLADIAELWRRGSVIKSWLLDLTANALLSDPALEHYAGRVADSGEGRWTMTAAIDEAVSAPILSAALFERFNSRGAADFSNKVLSAMRFGFGGHVEKKLPPD